MAEVFGQNFEIVSCIETWLSVLDSVVFGALKATIFLRHFFSLLASSSNVDSKHGFRENAREAINHETVHFDSVTVSAEAAAFLTSPAKGTSLRFWIRTPNTNSVNVIHSFRFNHVLRCHSDREHSKPLKNFQGSSWVHTTNHPQARISENSYRTWINASLSRFHSSLSLSKRQDVLKLQRSA